MAERFLYIPSIGPALLFGLALLGVFGYMEKSKRRGVKRERATVFFRIVVAGLVIVALLYGFGTLKRNAVWKSEFTLWEDVLKKYPTSRAYANLGLAYEEAGNIEEAERQYRNALELEPGYFIALNNLAANYVLLGRLDEAIELYGRALRAKPGNAVIHAGLARAYRYRGQVRESIYEYRRALELDPELGWAREELNALYRAIGVEGERRQE
jgi:tetratricopeptide (TPR) repeat protein